MLVLAYLVLTGKRNRQWLQGQNTYTESGLNGLITACYMRLDLALQRSLSRKIEGLTLLTIWQKIASHFLLSGAKLLQPLLDHKSLASVDTWQDSPCKLLVFVHYQQLLQSPLTIEKCTCSQLDKRARAFQSGTKHWFESQSQSARAKFSIQSRIKNTHAY